MMNKQAVQKGRAGSNVLVALVIKFLMTLVLAWVAFGLIDGNPWRTILVVALVATVLNYLIGDLLILKAAGNVVASIANGVLAAGAAWLMTMGVLVSALKASTLGLLAFAILIAIGEYFFHQYLLQTKHTMP